MSPYRVKDDRPEHRFYGFMRAKSKREPPHRCAIPGFWRTEFFVNVGDMYRCHDCGKVWQFQYWGPPEAPGRYKEWKESSIAAWAAAGGSE